MFDLSLQITPEYKFSLYKLKENTRITLAIESSTERESVLYLSKEEFLMMFKIMKIVKTQIEEEAKHG